MDISDTPADAPADAPVEAPVEAPVDAPVEAPVEAPADASGTLVDISPPPPRVTMADILAAQEVLVQTEAMDRAILASIGQMSAEGLRSILIRWATAGFPNAYAIQDITVTPPPRCSDGVTRSLADYITFCSGKTIQEHVAVLQAMLPDIAVAYSYTGASIQIVVSRTTE